MTGLGALFDFHWLMYITLWALAVASTVTVGQRIFVVWQQAKAEGPVAP